MISLFRTQANALYAFIVCIVFLLFSRDVLGAPINKYIFLAVCVFFFVISNYENISYMICFLIPLFNGLPGTYILLVALVCFLIKKDEFDIKPITLIVVFVSLELLCSIWYVNVDYLEMIEYFLTISIFFLMIYDSYRKMYSKCLCLYFIATFVFGLIVIVSGIKTAPDNWMELFAKGWFRFGETNSGGGSDMMLRGNANELAYYCVTGISVGLVVLEMIENKFRVVVGLMVVWLTVCGVLSLSRSFILVVSLIYLVYMLSKTNTVKGIVGVVFAFIIAITGVSYYLNAHPDLLDGFMTRFNDSTMSTGGGRTVLIMDYINRFFEIPRIWFTGAGVTRYKDVFGLSITIHNMMIQLFMCYGFFFSLYFLYAILRPVYEYRSNSKKWISWLPICVTLLFVQTIQFINPYSLMLPYIIALYATRVNPNDGILGDLYGVKND